METRGLLTSAVSEMHVVDSLPSTPNHTRRQLPNRCNTQQATSAPSESLRVGRVREDLVVECRRRLLYSRSSVLPSLAPTFSYPLLIPSHTSLITFLPFLHTPTASCLLISVPVPAARRHASRGPLLLASYITPLSFLALLHLRPCRLPIRSPSRFRIVSFLRPVLLISYPVRPTTLTLRHHHDHSRRVRPASVHTPPSHATNIPAPSFSARPSPLLLHSLPRCTVVVAPSPPRRLSPPSAPSVLEPSPPPLARCARYHLLSASGLLYLAIHATKTLIHRPLALRFPALLVFPRHARAPPPAVRAPSFPLTPHPPFPHTFLPAPPLAPSCHFTSPFLLARTLTLGPATSLPSALAFRSMYLREPRADDDGALALPPCDISRSPLCPLRSTSVRDLPPCESYRAPLSSASPGESSALRCRSSEFSSGGQNVGSVGRDMGSKGGVESRW
ncbi:hypothetical protein C8R44DRAFT_984721 [Mycena epipterygia]|nr:hypothetical protein C8R44DRAFT_984721 [Mycena epipterygia]